MGVVSDPIALRPSGSVGGDLKVLEPREVDVLTCVVKLFFSAGSSMVPDRSMSPPSAPNAILIILATMQGRH